MKIIFHRGTKQIGGCATEIRNNAETVSVLIDFGEQLPDANKQTSTVDHINVQGFSKNTKDSTSTEKHIERAVFFTHYHGDHIGHFCHIKDEIPMYMGEGAKQIYYMLQKELDKVRALKKEQTLARCVQQIKGFQDGEVITVENGADKIIVKTIKVNHSAYDAYAFIITADDETIIHTGDFRDHGLNTRSVIEAFPKKCTALITEGTMLSRNDSYKPEEELGNEAEAIFERRKYTFVLCSSTNMDRIKTLYNHKGNRLFICDTYQNLLLKQLTQEGYHNFGEVYEYKLNRDTKNAFKQLFEATKERGFIMLCRNNRHFNTLLKQMKGQHLEQEMQILYSMWKGYCEGEQALEGLVELKKEYKRQLVEENRWFYLHTSGHANWETLKKLCEHVNPEKAIIPIHTEKPHQLYKVLEDNGLLKNKVLIAADKVPISLDTLDITKWHNTRMEELKRVAAQATRSISQEMISTLVNKDDPLSLVSLVDYVKSTETRTLGNQLELCFRGVEGKNTITVYYKTHAMFKIKQYKRKGSDLEKTNVIYFNIAHGRHLNRCRDGHWTFEKCIDRLNAIQDQGLLEKINISKDILKRKNTEVQIPFTNLLQSTWEMLGEIFGRMIDTHVCYLRHRKQGNGQPIEKEVQQKIMNLKKDIQEGYFIYDLEFAQKLPNASYEKLGRFDYLALKFENGRPINIAYIELKTSLESCNNCSGVEKHLKDMLRYRDYVQYIRETIKEDISEIPNFNEYRIQEAKEIYQHYAKLGLRGVPQSHSESNVDWSQLEREDLVPEIIFIFANEAINYLNNAKQLQHLKTYSQVKVWKYKDNPITF